MHSRPGFVATRLLLILAWIGMRAAPVLEASDGKFPYETVIEAEEAFVRSGPGSKYYPTGKLRRGAKVVVHREDPGGWFMIAPPPGSFSWIPAKYVEKTGQGQGTITTNQVAVRVGSFESDIREILQRTLSRGDEVHILGEKMLGPDATGGPAQSWYRIEPPRGEWRWIMGQAVAPARERERNPKDDPFASAEARDRPKRASPPVPHADDDSPSFQKPLVDPSHREYVSNESDADRSREGALGNRPLVRKESKSRPAANTNRRQEAILDELDRLDARFRSILEKNPLDWDFDELERDYQELHDQADNVNVQQMIDSRLGRIEGYRRDKSAEEELARVQAETGKRDAELAEIQRRQEAQLAALRQPRFDGAGIIERSALNRRGVPRYVLLNPSGRVLAYLVAAPGVNLEGWIGRAAGVFGSRVRHPDLGADLITVNRLSPVRLTP